MDDDTRKDYKGFSAKDWKDLGYDEIPRPCTLRGKIHPIFVNYNKKDRGFVGTDETYTMIMPALRLASNLLYSPKSCMFLYSIVYGERKPLFWGDKRLTSKGGQCTELSRVDKSLYCPKKMDRIWNELARYNHFSAIESDENDGQTDVKPLDGPDLRGNGRRGCVTRIRFNKRFLKDIRLLQRHGLDNSHAMLNLQFFLAYILCHEVAHAVNFASQTTLRAEIVKGLPKTPDPFLEGQKMAELGYAWCQEVFGGKLWGPRRGYPEQVSVVTDWRPDGEPCCMESVLERGSPVNPKKHPTFEAWVVDMQHISLAFSQDFWNIWAKLPTSQHKAQALKIPRTIGRLLPRHDREDSDGPYPTDYKVIRR